MAHVGEGFIRRDTGHIERASVYETRKGTEFAVTPGGLYLMPFAYEPEECYEIESEDDVIELGDRLDKRQIEIAEQERQRSYDFIPGATG